MPSPKTGCSLRSEMNRRNQGDDFALGGCRHGHPNSALVRFARKTKSGDRRWGITCSVCMKESRQRWLVANPEGRAAALVRYSEKRKLARKSA